MDRVLTWLALWSATTSAFQVPLSLPTASQCATGTIVDLGYAKYQGCSDTANNMSYYLNISFAAPPVGELRFKAPRPPHEVPGVQLATTLPNMCLQAGFSLPLPTSFTWLGYGAGQQSVLPPTPSEDCLFLNVFVPKSTPPSDGFPVVVWIHGGSWQLGSAAGYNGAAIVADSNNTVIAVVIQYRLGAFGFLAGNEVKAHGDLNAGLLDQQFALKWVQDHIASFHGDKNRVTIWGESAGATSVMEHIIANGGNTKPPLFESAMAISVAILSQYYYNDTVPQSVYDGMVDLTGCAASDDTFTCLQSADVVALQTVNQLLATTASYGTPAFNPVVDGTFIVDRPSVLLSQGKVNKFKALLAVNNLDEGALFVNQAETFTIQQYASLLFPRMTLAQLDQVATFYEAFGTPSSQAVKLFGDAIIACPTYALAQSFPGYSWKGLFGIPPDYHTMGLEYLFYGASYPPVWYNATFISAYSQSFIALAVNGDVNNKTYPTITPSWDTYNSSDTEMLFGCIPVIGCSCTNASWPVVMPISADPAKLERCKFWASVSNTTWQ